MNFHSTLSTLPPRPPKYGRPFSWNTTTRKMLVLWNINYIFTIPMPSTFWVAPDSWNVAKIFRIPLTISHFRSTWFIMHCGWSKYSCINLGGSLAQLQSNICQCWFQFWTNFFVYRRRASLHCVSRRLSCSSDHHGNFLVRQLPLDGLTNIIIRTTIMISVILYLISHDRTHFQWIILVVVTPAFRVNAGHVGIPQWSVMFPLVVIRNSCRSLLQLEFEIVCWAWSNSLNSTSLGRDIDVHLYTTNY